MLYKVQQIIFQVASYVGKQVKMIHVAKMPRTCEYLVTKVKLKDIKLLYVQTNV